MGIEFPPWNKIFSLTHLKALFIIKILVYELELYSRKYLPQIFFLEFPKFNKNVRLVYSHRIHMYPAVRVSLTYIINLSIDCQKKSSQILTWKSINLIIYYLFIIDLVNENMFSKCLSVIIYNFTYIHLLILRMTKFHLSHRILWVYFCYIFFWLISFHSTLI